MTDKDFNSFIDFAVLDNWVTGIRIFLESKAAHHYFSALFTYDKQRNIAHTLVTKCGEITDTKVKKLYS